MHLASISIPMPHSIETVMEVEIEVPSHFLCPISLLMMRDPVTVSTGITFDRDSIETWLFSCKNTTCPVTKQSLSSTDLTPNHTLRRLIQAWCMLNASRGVQRIPTPNPQLDKTQIVKLLTDAKNLPHMQLTCLRRIKTMALDNDRIKNCLEDAGAIEVLASLVKNHGSDADKDSGGSASEEALIILCHLRSTETQLKNMAVNDDLFESLVRILKSGSYQSRAHAAILIKSVFGSADPTRLIAVKPELFGEVVRVVRDRISLAATKAGLKLLMELCPWGRNRIKAVESDAVTVLVELLLDTWDKRSVELVLMVLDQLCGCAEGRAELVGHGAGLAVVSKKILRVSHVATDRAVRILGSISRHAGAERVVQEMVEVGVVSKLCLVLQVETSLKAKERAREILKSHSRSWRSSPCVPPHLLSSYPSSSS